MMKLVGTGVLLVALLGVFVDGIVEMFGGGDDPADYPRCAEIVRHLGTYPEAKCTTGDDVIEVQYYTGWDTYHPDY